MPLQQFVVEVVKNNPVGTIEQLNINGFAAANEKQAIETLHDLIDNNEISVAEKVLNKVDFIDRGDYFSHWAKCQTKMYAEQQGANIPKTTIWEVLGGVLQGVGGVLTGDLGSNAAPPPPPPPPPSFMEKYGFVIVLTGIGLGAIYLANR